MASNIIMACEWTTPESTPQFYGVWGSTACLWLYPFACK